MKQLLFYILTLTFAILLTTSSCSDGKTAKAHGTDTVSITVDTLSCNSIFTKSNGTKCLQNVNLRIELPTKYKNKKAIAKLQQLFCDAVLDINDSINIDDAITRFATSLLIQDSRQDEQHSYDYANDDGDVLVDNIGMDIDVKMIYNDYDIVTFVKCETVTKNKRITSVIHRYFSFDLQAMALIELNRMFNDSRLDEITTLLKDKLLEQNNVDNEDQLNELGYFNLPNLSVTNNFYFTGDSITWSYEPNMLAVSTVGEPRISLAIDELAPFMLDNSLLHRFK